MGKSLIIVEIWYSDEVESPTKARTLIKFLGQGYIVKATVGHIKDLARRDIGLDIEHGFRPRFETIEGKAQTIHEIKKAAEEAKKVYIGSLEAKEGSCPPCGAPALFIHNGPAMCLWESCKKGRQKENENVEK